MCAMDGYSYRSAVGAAQLWIGCAVPMSRNRSRGDEAEPPHSQVITSTYHMHKLSQEWRLQRWEMAPGGPPEAVDPG